MPYVAVHIRVQDYDRWKAMWETNKAVREAAGVHEQLLRTDGASNEVVLLVEHDSLERARQWTQSPQVRAAQQRGGVEQATVYYPEAWLS